MASKEGTGECRSGLLMPVNQTAENLVRRPSRMDAFLLSECEPTGRLPARPDQSVPRRHFLRFADDKTEGLGVNAVKRCRLRSPILFRGHTAHEGARLT